MLSLGHCSVGTTGLSKNFQPSLLEEISVHAVVKLWPIASYNRLGYSEQADDAPPHE